jgi:glycosyltransferase involved in cell wall biosynthesis
MTSEVMPILCSAEGDHSVVWIEWDRHLRSRSISRRLDVALEEVCTRGGRLRRYVTNMWRTMKIIRHRRPDVVIATNPSIVLGMLLIVLRRSYGFRLVSDSHFCGVMAFNKSWFLQRVLDFHNSRVDLVIVTNERHARYIADLGTRAYVCQDPLPEIPRIPNSTLDLGERSVFLVCSFDPDEPYEAAFEAFESLQEDGFTLYVSGNYRKATSDLSRFPWVRLLGFLETEKYYAHLVSASVVVDLTTSDDCLVCGAYEALAAGKPLIVSRTSALEAYFGGAAILTENTPQAIRESVLSAFARRDALAADARSWAAHNTEYMDARIAGLRTLLRGSNDHSTMTTAPGAVRQSPSPPARYFRASR